MSTYVLLTKISPQAVKDPRSIEELGKRVSEKIKTHCPEVNWVASYAVLGPYDYLDIFEAPNDSAATKVSVLIRSFGHATTETWPATPWNGFLELVRGVRGRTPARKRKTRKR